MSIYMMVFGAIVAASYVINIKIKFYLAQTHAQICGIHQI